MIFKQKKIQVVFMDHKLCHIFKQKAINMKLSVHSFMIRVKELTAKDSYWSIVHNKK